MSNDLVAYSREGDVFHYRWAARRCLQLIYPNTSVAEIFIEGSKEIQKDGEYVIDVSEYHISNKGKKKIDYYQLKHTTVAADNPFTLSDLKDTIEGFSARFKQHQQENDPKLPGYSFTVITNRKIADSFKTNLSAIVQKTPVQQNFRDTIEKYTGLNANDLVSFCSVLHLEDSEGNYNVQKEELRIELSQLVAGVIDNIQINHLIALVQEKVFSDSDGLINREQVLKRFGLTSERALYPAPAKWEQAGNIIPREHHTVLAASIAASAHPVIVEAAGGVGKSVFCLQLINNLPEGSLSIAYDCFGAGSYRSRSELRHRHRQALVQIANELAAKGLCDPLYVLDTNMDEDIMRAFLKRLQTSVLALKKANGTAQLYILIDAADNAEMAAKEYAQSCFANELLREQMPEGCKLVLLCRPERKHLLKPPGFVFPLELPPFSEAETLQNLKQKFPEAEVKDGAEFHRLTSGNPRVQANALDVTYNSLPELLAALGPGMSVDQQIENQLHAAVSKIKDHLPDHHHQQINSICLGLASLPPHISIDVLAQVANVTQAEIKSFVADMGRSLWLSDSSVQFRDEPTETWFRNTFMATPENYAAYINILEPFAGQLSYVAEALPQLYLQAEQYDKLISIALTDSYLPENNPIDARNIRIYRLQFAFKAALRSGNKKDAVQLAMRAGEEVAGEQRQLNLFKSNIDLLTTLQSKEKVQEIAFKRLLGSSWDGSENIYSASLLSGIKEYQGEARSYLRAAMNWLDIQLEEQKKGEARFINNEIHDNDVLELAYAFLNIQGVKNCSDFLRSWTSRAWLFSVVQSLVKRLIDLGRFQEIEELLATFTTEPYYMVAAASELIQVGHFPNLQQTERCLTQLCSKKGRIKNPVHSYDEPIKPAILSLLEACLHHNLPSQNILRALKHYVPIRANNMVYSAHSFRERTIYLKALAIRSVLSGQSTVDINAIAPEKLVENKKDYDHNRDLTEFKEVINGLFPWYLLRASILLDKSIKLLDQVDAVNKSARNAVISRYRGNDTLPEEIARLCASILICYPQGTPAEIADFYTRFLKSNLAFSLSEQLNILRAAYRTPHLSNMAQDIELTGRQLVAASHNSGPDEISDLYMDLSRAVLLNSSEDASVYFDQAIAIASKFGDELTERWNAVEALAEKACEGSPPDSDELAYRFIRCAELVGEYIHREKHWRRSHAMRICTRMAPAIGMAALSRWRDRGIGDFEEQLETLLNELVTTSKLSSSVGWAITPFFYGHYSQYFLKACLDNESVQVIKENIVAHAIHMLRQDGTNDIYWSKLKEIADSAGVNNEALNNIIAFFEQKHTARPEPDGIETNDHGSPQNWDTVFHEADLNSIEGLNSLIKKYKETNHQYFLIRNLLKEALNRTQGKSLKTFFENLLQLDDIKHYDIQATLHALPREWKARVGFQAAFPDIMLKIGARFAHEFTNIYSFNSFVKELELDKPLTEKLVTGILSGLSNGNELASQSMFFGFVQVTAPYLTGQEAVGLLDYSLARFELHINPDFGDGPWQPDLHVAHDIENNVAGFIWSALGSPRSAVRWNTAHSIRLLARFNADGCIDALVSWLQQDKVGGFGHAAFPFYKLHARQYLLIAFARVVMENPAKLLKHSAAFIPYTQEAHALIQKFAVDIILRLEDVFPGTYAPDILDAVHKVGKSNLPVQIEDYGYTADSYWHQQGVVETGIDFHFGLDIDKHWYKPLGEIFRVPTRQIEHLAANVIVKEWGLGDQNGYYKDPRAPLWNNSSDRETWYRKEEYPRTDNQDFYLSYHAMLVVAARLLEKMPIVKAKEQEEYDQWAAWLSRHLLTRDDGKWLADARDPLPLDRSVILSGKDKQTWLNSITEQEFLNCILSKNEAGHAWVNVKGDWHDRTEQFTEACAITTALVSSQTADALLRALDTCADPMDYKLPDYEEGDMEIDSGKFQLKGWINDRYNSKRLDEFDPYADGINYPPYTIGNTVMDRLQLTADPDGKSCKTADTGAKVIDCEIWSSRRESHEKEPDQTGIRLKTSLAFLKALCSEYQVDMMFEVSIKREENYRYSGDKKEYAKPKYKIFILSKDGTIRSATSNTPLG